MKRREFLKGLAVGGAAVAAGACHGDVAPAGTVRVSNDVPVLGDYDVCVVGAGPGGVGAAIAAARAGKRTILVEWKFNPLMIPFVSFLHYNGKYISYQLPADAFREPVKRGRLKLFHAPVICNKTVSLVLYIGYLGIYCRAKPLADKRKYLVRIELRYGV